jgi:glycosyltransferase involved in cell wall biosynthesis
MTPLVTVLMAVHNGARFVDSAIGSILRQHFTDFELLIVDDGSTDDTPARIRAFGDSRIRCVRNDTNLGLTRSLNVGLSVARGALIARQDADDISHPGRLSTQVAFLQRQPDVAVLGTQARTINARKRLVRVAPWPKSTSNRAIRWQLIFDSPFIHSSVMFRKSVVSALGGYNESFTTSQDFELWSRVAAAGHEMRNLPDELLDFRVHEASVSAGYGLEHVAKLRAVLRDNLIAQLGAAAIPADWPDMWIRMNNPRVFPASADAPLALAEAIESIYVRFVDRYPVAAGDGEIRRHLGAMLIRLASSSAERGWMTSLVPFLRAARLDAMMAASAAPLYVARLTIGQWRPRGRHDRQTPPGKQDATGVHRGSE